MADPETVQAPAAGGQADDPDTRRVRIQRVEHADGPATCISYDDGSGSLQQWHPDPTQDVFEVKAIIADAAVRSSFFEQAADTKTRLKAAGRKSSDSTETGKES